MQFGEMRKDDPFVENICAEILLNDAGDWIHQQRQTSVRDLNIDKNLHDAECILDTLLEFVHKVPPLPPDVECRQMRLYVRGLFGHD